MMDKAELVHLVNVLRTARNAMNERRAYANKHWKEKHDRAWNREDKIVRDTLEAYEEELNGL
jgi:hypothetical protein